MAWRRRWVIAIPFLVCVLATLVVSSKLRNQYQSEALIQIVPQQVPNSYVESTVTMRTEERLEAVRQQVLSRTELERLISSFNLYQLERARLPMQDVVELMRAHATIEPVLTGSRRSPETDAFYVRFTYTNPKIAAQVTERLASLFIDQNARDRGQFAEATDEFLQGQLADVRRRLEEQEAKLERFREQHSGRLPSQLQFNMQALQNAQLRLQAHSEAMARDRERRLLLERLYADAQQAELALVVREPSPSIRVEEGFANGRTAQERLALARMSLERLELRLKSGHPDVIRARRVIQRLEVEAAEEAKHSTTADASAVSPDTLARLERLTQMQAEIESLDRQIRVKETEERRLQEDVASFQARVEAVPATESEWVKLTRDYDTQQAAYRDLLSKSEQAKLAANLERRQIGEQFRILDPARVPIKPVSPKRMQITAIGSLSGLLVGLLFAALLEVRDRTFSTDLDVTEALGLPVVAVVPQIESEDDLHWSRRRRMAISAIGGLALATALYIFWVMKLWRFAL